MEPQRDWFDKDYYKILGVPSDASAAEVTKAYRRLAKEFHPDSNQGDAAADERFKEVAAAYDVVGDEAKRKSYDEVRRMGPTAGVFGGSGPVGGFKFEQMGDMGNLFGDLLGRRRAAAAQHGDDVETELKLDFADAVSGATVSLAVTGEAPCGDCKGSGAAPPSAPRSCDACSGSGVNAENQGLFSFSRPCRACSGSGAVIDDPCDACDGLGAQQRRRTVKARIPAGVGDGQRIKLAGRGAPGRGPGAKPGDLYVRVRVKPHRLFERSGKNLTLRVPVSFDEAVLGAEVSVPTLDGSSVTIRIPPGTATGRRLRIPAAAGAAAAEADLIVDVEVVIPQELSEAQRAAVEAFAAARTVDPRAHLHPVPRSGAPQHPRKADAADNAAAAAGTQPDGSDTRCQNPDSEAQQAGEANPAGEANQDREQNQDREAEAKEDADER